MASFCFFNILLSFIKTVVTQISDGKRKEWNLLVYVLSHTYNFIFAIKMVTLNVFITSVFFFNLKQK